MEFPMKMYWRGEDVETLPKETLIEIIKSLHRDVEATRSCMRSVIEINTLASRARQRF